MNRRIRSLFRTPRPNTRRLLAVTPLEDRVTPVTVTGTVPALTGGTLPAAATSLEVNYSAPVVGGASAGNFELRGIGADGLIGTADDVLVTLTPGYSGTTTSLTFAQLPTLSVANVWRLTARAMITDTNGIPLDGDANGNPGGDFVREFVGEPTPFVTLTSPGGLPFDIQHGGTGSGQLLQGPADAFDGVNRLSVGGVAYQPPVPTIPGTTPFVTSNGGSSIMATADGTYHDLPGYARTFAADGGPVDVSVLLQVTNFGAVASDSFYRLLIDGTPVGLPRYLGIPIGYYAQVRLEEALTGLSPGAHTVQVQAQTTQPLRVDQGTVTAFVHPGIPFYGPGTVTTVTSNGSSSIMATADGAYHDLPGYVRTFTSDGSPARAFVLLQVTNFAAAGSDSFYRLLLDGTPIGLDRYIGLQAGYYGQVTLEEVLTGLTPGSHTLQVQARTADPLRIDLGTVAVSQFPPIPRVGPGTEPVVTSNGGSSIMATADGAYHNLPGYARTFIADGSPVRASVLLQVTNFGAVASDSFYRLLLDGTPVGLERYRGLPLGYYGQVALEEVLSGLTSGPHTLQVQASTAKALRIDQGTVAIYQFHRFPNPTLADGGRTVVTPAQIFSGLVVSREVTVPATGTHDFARTVEVITNPTANTITTPVRITGNLGSTQTVFATGSGNLTVDLADPWIGTDDADGTGSPAVVHYIHGPSGLRPTTVSVIGDNITWTFDVTLTPGQTVRLATFTVLGATRAAAVAAAQTLVGPTGFGGQAAAFLSPAQVQTVANFGFAPVVVSPASLPNALVGTAYSQVLTAAGPPGPYTFAVTAGSLPAGLTLSSSGVLSGTPTTGGMAAFTVTATNTAADAGNRGYSLTVDVPVIPLPPGVRVEVAANAAEPGTAGSLRFVRTGDQSQALSVAYTVGGSATAGVDFAALAGTVAIPAGQSVVLVALNVLNDLAIEGTETVTVTLTAGAGFGIVGGPATLTIGDDDVSPPPPPLPAGRQFAVGADAGSGAVRLLNADRSERFSSTPFAGFAGGVRVAAADFDRDGIADLVAGTGPGGPTHVRILSGADQHVLFTIDPFEASFTGGVYVAAGDVNGDGVADLAITPDEGGGPRVRVFNGVGFGQLADFFGIDDTSFRGGARAAIGDINGDGAADLIVAAGFQGGPRVAGFSGASLATGPVKLFADFLAFEPALRNGSYVAAGDLDGDGFAELLAGGGPGGGPRLTAFSGKSLLNNQQVVLANFFAGDVTNRGGVRLAVKDLDGDARADVVAGSGAGAGSRVTTYAGKSLTGGNPPELFALDAFPGFQGGVFVG